MKITGLLIYYYFVCPRKLWFYSHKITMEQESELVKIGKYIELFYKEDKRKEKKIIIDDIISPDILEKKRDFVLVFEIKKSKRFFEASLWQLKYYLWYLKEFKNLKVKGRLVIPEENKEYIVELSERDEKRLKEIMKRIKEIIKMNKPPRVQKKPFCNNCSYKELCF